MRLERLRRMTREEVQWRLGVALRTTTERITSRIRPRQWTRNAIADALSPGVVDGELRRSVAAGRWMDAHAALAATLRSRPARHVLDPSAAPLLRETISRHWPDAASQAIAGADRLLQGQYDVLGYRGLAFARNGTGIDWHFDPVHRRGAPLLFYADVPYLDSAIGDHKVIWEMNRHQHWLQLGRAAWLANDSRYARRIVEDLRSWIDHNPPLTGINWASMLEIGFRALSWTWALHCLLAVDGVDSETPWLVDLFVALDRQLAHVEHNLSYYFSPNTHLTGEALALYVVGTALPELAASGRWAATGRRILLTEIDRQIYADGGHAERSAHYQRYTLDFYLLALLTARVAGDSAAEARFADAARRLAEFTRALANDDGQLPLLGDDDGGMLWPLTGRRCADVRDSLSVAAVALRRPDLAPWGIQEEAAWIGGPEAVTGHGADRQHHVDAEVEASRTLRDTGYVIVRDGAGGHAVFDTGAHGYMNGGHAHADALSITLTLGNHALLVDPGTATYTMSAALRDRMRSSMSHNTVTIDGRSQSIPSGPFHWRTRTDARLHTSRHNPAFDWVEASHDGYAPTQHRRTMLRTQDGGWLLADEILGDGRHAASAHWHFDPAWMLTQEPGRLRASHITGAVAWLLHDGSPAVLFHGDEEAGLGWHAPVYGTLVPSWSARVTSERNAPFTMVTWIGDGGDWISPAVQHIEAACDSASPVIAVQIGDGDRSAVFMLRPGGAAPHAARACRVLDYETDARVLHYVTDRDRLLSLAVADARHIATLKDWISIDADEPITDLHVGFDEATLDLRTSTVPPLLNVRVGRAFRAIRLNGRELAPRRLTQTGPLLLHGTDWGVLAHAPQSWFHSGKAFARH
jgi:hypothetical protein